jgi:hypothetical protein
MIRNDCALPNEPESTRSAPEQLKPRLQMATDIILTFVLKSDKLARLARYKDAGRSLRLVERERFPRAGARHLRSRAAPA